MTTRHYLCVDANQNVRLTQDHRDANAVFRLHPVVKVTPVFTVVVKVTPVFTVVVKVMPVFTVVVKVTPVFTASPWDVTRGNVSQTGFI